MIFDSFKSRFGLNTWHYNRNSIYKFGDEISQQRSLFEKIGGDINGSKNETIKTDKYEDI